MQTTVFTVFAARPASHPQAPLPPVQPKPDLGPRMFTPHPVSLSVSAWWCLFVSLSVSVSLPPPHPRTLRHGGPVVVILPYPGGFSGCSQFQSPAGLPPCLELRLPSRDTCLPETPESLGTAWGGAPPREVEAPPSSLSCWGGLRGLRGPSRRGEGALVTPSDLQDSLGPPAPHAWTAAPNTHLDAQTRTCTRPAPPCHTGVRRGV